MARGEESTEERVRRSVARTVGGALVLVALLAGLAFWASFGVYRLDPGEAAVILRLGRYADTEVREGLRWHLPPPIETREIVNVGSIARQEFGEAAAAAAAAAAPPVAEGEVKSEAMSEATMQTGDNNIVHLEFVVQYRVGKPFEALYRIADQRDTLRDSAQAAMREVVGRNTIDGVLSEKRGAVEGEALELLQSLLDRYESGLYVLSVQLQEVQPPQPVRAAFDDVIAAAQDRNRAVNEAQGYANEVLPQARAEAAEATEQALGYRQSKIAQAEGDAQRFTAVAAEYQKAPEVTRKRLYLETMEAVLPDVEKVVIEPGTASVLPYLPIGRAKEDGR
jgi:membrane protease subunit HflK